MRHDAHGHWIASADDVDPRPPLQGERSCAVAVVGGGYTGMWAAWWLKQHDPDADVVLIEADVCGHGPSGRNGGFVNSLWFSLPSLVARFGDEAALEVTGLADESLDEIGSWCEAQGVDARFRRSGYIQASTCEAQDGTWEPVLAELRRLGIDDACRVLSREELQRRCASPRFREGAFYPAAATVDPARLAAGLRAKADRGRRRGVRAHAARPAQGRGAAAAAS